MFTGLSVLRKAEKKEPTQQDKALQDYLKRQYGGGSTADEEPKRKKKKKSKQAPAAIAIVDADITVLPPVDEAVAKPARPQLADEAADSEGEWGAAAVLGLCPPSCTVYMSLYGCITASP
jgi:hypothetical protein